MSQTLAAASQRRPSAATAAPVRVPRPRPKPALRVVPAPAVDRGRTAFVVGCMVLLVGGLIGLLMINTSLAQGSFRLHDLQQRSKVLADRQQALQQSIDALAAPEQLAARATALGMVPSTGAAFLRLPDGRVLGVAQRAVPAATPTVKATATTAKPKPATAPTAKPSATSGTTSKSTKAPKPGATSGATKPKTR